MSREPNVLIANRVDDTQHERFVLAGGWMRGSAPFFRQLTTFVGLGVLGPCWLWSWQSTRLQLIAVMLWLCALGYAGSFLWAVVGPLLGSNGPLPAVSQNRALAVLDPADRAQLSRYQCERIEVKRVLIVVNPFGGGGRALRLVREVIVPAFERRGVQTVVRATQYAGHAFDVAAGAEDQLQQFDVLCAVGGDGTVHELVNGLCSRPLDDPARRTPIGLVAGGSGCSVAQDLNCLDPTDAVTRICDGYVRAVDSNLIGVRRRTDALADPADNIEGGGRAPLALHSINTFGIGINGDSAVFAEGLRALGAKRYDVVATWMMLKRRTFQLTVYADQQEVFRGPAISAFVNHTQHFGAGFRPCPAATMDDGLLEYTVLTAAMSTGAALGVMGLLLRTGQHTGVPNLVAGQAKRVRFVTDSPGISNFDGELYPFGRVIDAQVVPRAFRLMAPFDIGVIGQ